MSNCLVCDLEVDPTERRYLLGIDNPYVNIYLHRDCWDNIKEHSDTYLRENLLKYLEKYDIINQNSKNKSNSGIIKNRRRY